MRLSRGQKEKKNTQRNDFTKEGKGRETDASGEGVEGRRKEDVEESQKLELTVRKSGERDGMMACVEKRERGYGG